MTRSVGLWPCHAKRENQGQTQLLAVTRLTGGRPTGSRWADPLAALVAGIAAAGRVVVPLVPVQLAVAAPTAGQMFEQIAEGVLHREQDAMHGPAGVAAATQSTGGFTATARLDSATRLEAASRLAATTRFDATTDLATAAGFAAIGPCADADGGAVARAAAVVLLERHPATADGLTAADGVATRHRFQGAALSSNDQRNKTQRQRVTQSFHRVPPPWWPPVSPSTGAFSSAAGAADASSIRSGIGECGDEKIR